MLLQKYQQHGNSMSEGLPGCPVWVRLGKALGWGRQPAQHPSSGQGQWSWTWLGGKVKLNMARMSCGVCVSREETGPCWEHKKIRSVKDKSLVGFKLALTAFTTKIIGCPPAPALSSWLETSRLQSVCFSPKVRPSSCSRGSVCSQRVIRSCHERRKTERFSAEKENYWKKTWS